MKIAEMLALFEKLKTKKVCVVGDFIVDHNRIVRSKRLSPEAPIPIVEPEFEEFRLGGAGNVANNLRALGVGKVTIMTVIGPKNYKSDSFSPADQELLSSSGVVFEKGRLTTVKERVVTRRQQIVRIDTQSNCPIKPKTVKALQGMIDQNIGTADAVVFSDYAHGVCVPAFIAAVEAVCFTKGIPMVVDSKAKDTAVKYVGTTIAIPNLDEAKFILRTEESDEHKVALSLLSALKLQAAAVTLGPKGIMLATAEGTKHYPALNCDSPQEVVDVTGAGDTVAAIVAIGLVLKFSYDDIFRLANVAAGVKVQKRGVATVTPQEIAAIVSTNAV
jgi:D-beta-D-heptose 7-phosphate kinase/D-beta-D-heptose 1-phosphate adenosyltransferase